jgi:hypothetical protein
MSKIVIDLSDLRPSIIARLAGSIRGQLSYEYNDEVNTLADTLNEYAEQQMGYRETNRFLQEGFTLEK